MAAAAPPKFPTDQLERELILSAELTEADQRRAQRLTKDGKLHRIQAGVFTPLATEHWPKLIARHRLRVLGRLFENAVIGYHSAYAGGLPVDDRIYLTYTYSKTVPLPGLEVVLIKGPGPLDGDMRMQDALYLSGEARQLLENLVPNRGEDRRAAGEAAVESRLITICQSRGEVALNKLRDEASRLSAQLGRQKEASKLSMMIGAILGTKPAHRAITPEGQALAQGIDHGRMKLFQALVSILNETEHSTILDVAPNGDKKLHAALYESYFSNYIEGTKFSIEQASEIVLEGKPVKNRPKDSKDIAGVFHQANEPGWRVQTLASGKPILEQLRARHAHLMEARPEVDPGAFKTEKNFAGNTEFVPPNLVAGTLEEASALLPLVRPGFPRAVLAHFLVVEIHPFVDGNGRLSRLVMNAELSAMGLTRIIIPTISRDDYLGALRLLTHENNALPLIRFLARMQEWTASFDYADASSLQAQMERCNAFQEDTSKYRLEWLKPSQGG